MEDKTIKAITKEFEQSENTILIIRDNKLKLNLEIKRCDVMKFTYACSEKDEVYLDFITRRKVGMYKGNYEKSELIKNWCIDKYCKIKIRKEID